MTQPPVDAQLLTDTDTHVFEAIVTLEYTGREPSRGAIAAAARLDDRDLDEALTELTTAGLVSVRQVNEEAVYTPSRRDWSTEPGQAAGHPMS